MKMMVTAFVIHMPAGSVAISQFKRLSAIKYVACMYDIGQGSQAECNVVLRRNGPKH